jgi:hypothetical protein
VTWDVEDIPLLMSLANDKRGSYDTRDFVPTKKKILSVSLIPAPSLIFTCKLGRQFACP